MDPFDKDNYWHTLVELNADAGAPEASLIKSAAMGVLAFYNSGDMESAREAYQGYLDAKAIDIIDAYKRATAHAKSSETKAKDYRDRDEAIHNYAIFIRRRQPALSDSAIARRLRSEWHDTDAAGDDPDEQPLSEKRIRDILRTFRN